MDKRKNTTRDREVRRAQLTARLSDKQRQLSEYSDKAAHCEKIIRECREQLEDGRDRKHFRWFVPAALLAVGGGFFLSLGNKVLAYICFAAAVIAGGRWLADFLHCRRKYGRVVRRLQHNIRECDSLNDKTSQLRLETLELRQELDRLDLES